MEVKNIKRLLLTLVQLLLIFHLLYTILYLIIWNGSVMQIPKIIAKVNFLKRISQMESQFVSIMIYHNSQKVHWNFLKAILSSIF